MTEVVIPSMPPSVAEIFRQVCAAHGMSVAELVGYRPTKAFAAARFEAIFRVNTEIKINGGAPSFPQIGRWMNRDHTSIHHGLRRYRELSALATPMSRKRPTAINPAPHRHQLAQDLAESA